jgi:hypothetical protein
VNVNVENFAVFGAAGGIMRPQRSPQLLGADAGALAHDVENFLFERRKG